MKRKIFISTFIAFIGLLIGVLSIKSYKTQKIAKEEEKYISVSLVGAVRFHNPFLVKAGSTLGDLLKRAEIIYGADLAKIDKSEKLYKNSELLIPFLKGREKKYPIIKGISISLLTSHGIRSNTAKVIVGFIKNKHGKGVTWKELDSLRGVGEVTLDQLKKILDLN